jgi:hypothetical protein
MPSAGERQAAADVLAKAKARTHRVSLVLDGDLLDEHERLTAALAGLPEGANSEAIEFDLDELDDQIREAEITFVFRGIGRGRWRKLLADHPPTEDDKAIGSEFNSETFPFAAMAASIIEPALGEADLLALNEETLAEVDFQEIWLACLIANLGSAGSTRPESRAARASAANGRRNSPPPSGSESPEAS